MFIDWTEILIAIFTLLFGVVVKAATSYFTAKAKTEKLFAVIGDVAESVNTAVKYVSQTYVEDIKAKAEDGKLTDEEKSEALHTAIENAASTLTNDTKDFLAKNGVEIGTYLEGKIEARIADNKW